jgi:hypothetical protein
MGRGVRISDPHVKKAKLSGSNDNDVDDYIPVTDKSTNNNMDEDGGMSQDGELLRQAIERHRKAFMDKAFPSFGVSDANDDNESSFSVGDSVQITGLDINPEYNDMRGIIISDIDHATNRCGVRIPAIRKVLGLKVDNLRMICEAKKSSSGDTISYTSTKQMSASMTTCRSQKDLDYVVEVVTGWQVGLILRRNHKVKIGQICLHFDRSIHWGLNLSNTLPLSPLLCLVILHHA